MKKIVTLFLALLFSAAPAFAALDAVDNVPAATLMLPYFEVDLMNANGAQTSFNVANAGGQPIVAHVTLWTDRGVPTYAFNVVLPARDLVEIDLRLLFVRGLLPQSEPDIFASCIGLIPPAQLDAATLAGLQNAHTGQASTLLSNNCGATSASDNKARGFITIDAALGCTASNNYPSTPGYFTQTSTSNVLWGDYTFTDRANDLSHADTLVHIEAQGATYASGDYTFYGRLVAEAATDAREPLPDQWLGRYDFGNVFNRTDALIWRDAWPAATFPCATPPPDLSVEGVISFDDQEQVSMNGAGASVPYATQRVDLATSSFNIPFDAGWLFYDLRRRAPSFSGSSFGLNNQAFVSHIFRTNGGSAGQHTAWPFGEFNQNFSQYGLTSSQCSDGADNDLDGFVDYPADPQCRSAAEGVENPQCGDGIDNDLDGQIDSPADTGCWGPLDDTELGTSSVCDDGIDNDGDGLVDFIDDDGCTSAFDNTEYFGQCDNGIDDDSDGQIDMADSGCSSPTDNSELSPICSNGIDDDGDGLTDYPNDPGCSSAGFFTESPACNDGIDNDGDGLVDMADPGCVAATSMIENPQCNNGVDDDGDGLVDLADAGCSSATDSKENAACSDGIDNDGDGLIDFPNETGCANADDLTEAADCNDGVDNDLDGLIDFPGDPGCASANDLIEFTGSTTRGCSDGVDNDGDGLADYPADSGCTSAYDASEFNQ